MLRFDYKLAQVPADEFIERVLVRGLGVRYLLVGDDFRFGARRSGDFSLLKNFAFTETQRLQLRGEIFNLFNRPNFGNPDTTVFINEVLNPDAGRIRTTVGSSRQIQLGLRYTF